jgi:polysaccharide chain length determinant protein (PEP-CTERM system associated)
MIPGRTYTAVELLDMVWSRRWLVLMSAAIATAVTVPVAGLLPDKYRAETLILAAGQSMSNDYVRMTVANQTRTKDSFPSISQEILSRSRLEQIIQDFGLYPEIRRSKPMEVAVDYMRTQIDIKTIEGSETFRVTYEATNPVVAMKVAERLSSFFIEENSKDRFALAAQTSAFLESQLQNARQRLVEQERRLEAYRLKYGPELPTQLQSNLQVIQNTQAQSQALSEAINRLSDRRLLIAHQLADLQSEQYLADPTAIASGAVGTSASAQLEAAQLELRSLESRLTPQHPDRLRARQLVADLQNQVRLEAMSSKSQAASTPPTAVEIARRNKVKELQAEMESLDRQIAANAGEMTERRAALDEYQKRVEAVPTRESELIAITRDYDTLQTVYRQLLAKKEDSKIAENLEHRQVIEQFKVLDPPRQPARPFSPNRRLIDAAGAVLGLALGVAMAVLLGYFDKRIQVEADLRAVVDLPVFALIPAIVTTRERRRARWKHAAASMALLAVFAVCATVAWLTFRA